MKGKLAAQGLTPHEKDLFDCRRSLHDGLGANACFTGNGATEFTLKQFNDADAVIIIEDLTTI